MVRQLECILLCHPLVEQFHTLVHIWQDQQDFDLRVTRKAVAGDVGASKRQAMQWSGVLVVLLVS